MAGRNKTGRKDVFTKDHLDMADEYLERFEELGAVVPTVAGMSLYLGVVKATLLRWADQNPRLLNALGKCSSIQEEILIQKGLKSITQPQITKLLLSNHGYSERFQNELSGRDGEPLQFTIKRASDVDQD